MPAPRAPAAGRGPRARAGRAIPSAAWATPSVRYGSARASASGRPPWGPCAAVGVLGLRPVRRSAGAFPTAASDPPRLPHAPGPVPGSRSRGAAATAARWLTASGVPHGGDPGVRVPGRGACATAVRGPRHRGSDDANGRMPSCVCRRAGGRDRARQSARVRAPALVPVHYGGGRRPGPRSQRGDRRLAAHGLQRPRHSGPAGAQPAHRRRCVVPPRPVRVRAATGLRRGGCRWPAVRRRGGSREEYVRR